MRARYRRILREDGTSGSIRPSRTCHKMQVIIYLILQSLELLILKTIKMVFKISNIPWNKGKVGVYSEETLLKIGESSRGRKHTEETKKKISESLKGNTFALGSHPTRESINKRRQKLIGRKYTEEHKKAISLSRIGMPMSEEAKKKLRLRIYSEETKNKIRLKRLCQVFPLKDTSIERKLQDGLRERGVEFIKHKQIIGQPDLFIEPNICIFADGDYWHTKIEGVTEKDVRVNQKLNQLGFKVLRYWEHEINNNTDDCIDEIIDVINIRAR